MDRPESSETLFVPCDLHPCGDLTGKRSGLHMAGLKKSLPKPDVANGFWPQVLNCRSNTHININAFSTTFLVVISRDQPV
jgi:hypothetical protein